MIKVTKVLVRRVVSQAIILILVCSLAPLAMATPVNYAQNREEGFLENIWRRITRRPHENERSDSAGSGGANHDRCLYTTEELVAIVPVSSETGIPYIEPTISGYPTWWFYVPYSGNGRLESEFVLIDASERIIYQKKEILPAESGLLKVVWPQTESPLSHSERYRWVFSVLCNPSNRSGDATVNGWVRRVSASEEAFLMHSLDLSQRDYVIYAESLYWFDLLAEVNQLRTEEPEVFEPLWDALLCQVYTQYSRLENFAEDCALFPAPAVSNTIEDSE